MAQAGSLFSTPPLPHHPARCGHPQDEYMK